jgi:oxygen-independent coproporphyrinogen-3 oxidase
MAGLYLHTPFCAQKCHYCDFFSAPPAADQLETWHLLLQQNLQLIADPSTPEIESIFFGGGTPSLLTAEQISSILNCCRELFPVSPNAEISIEANPGTLTASSLEGYLTAGVNRLSLGIQSFDNKNLQLLGRKHSAEDATQSFFQARDIGFTNISIDLIFALPGQGPSDLAQEVEKLLELSPDHVGIYGLSVEAETPLEKMVETGQVSEVDEETYAENYLLLNRLLSDTGYDHYEISNFARPGSRCLHNQAYWQRKTCLAAGAGAHGFDDRAYGKRTAITTDLKRYQQQLNARQNPAGLLEEFNLQQAMAETLYLALRTSDGINRAAFKQKFGPSLEEAFPQAFDHLRSHLQQKDDRYFFTVESWLLYDHLISHFL